jgi:hypothetical protein
VQPIDGENVPFFGASSLEKSVFEFTTLSGKGYPSPLHGVNLVTLLKKQSSGGVKDNSPS